MNEPTQTSGQPLQQPETPPKPGFCRRLFSLRPLKFCFVAAVALAVLVVVFYNEEKFRGYLAWKNYRQKLERMGYGFDVKSVQYPPTPPEKNLAHLPIFAPLLDATRKNKVADIPGYNEFSKKFHAPRETLNKLGYEDLWEVAGNWRISKTPDWNSKIRVKKGNQETINQPLPPEKAAEMLLDVIRQTLGPDMDVLQEEIKLRPVCDFEVNLNSPDSFPIIGTCLSPLIQLALAAAIRAEAELALRQSDAGWRDTKFGLELVDSIKNGPFIIDMFYFFIEIAMRQNALNPLWYGLATRQWNEAQIAELQALLEGRNYFEAAHRVLNKERILFNSYTFQSIIRTIQENQKYARSIRKDYIDTPDETTFFERVAIWSYPQGWFYFEKLNYQRFYVEKVLPQFPTNQAWVDLKQCNEHFEQVEKQLSSEGLIRTIFGHTIFLKLAHTSLRRIMLETARHQASINLAITACALERYRIANGKYPQQLQDLTPRYIARLPVDPVNGKPLIYRLNDDGSFILYSVGSNGVDDGWLVVSPEDSRKWDLESDWVWKYPSAQTNL